MIVIPEWFKWTFMVVVILGSLCAIAHFAIEVRDIMVRRQANKAYRHRVAENTRAAYRRAMQSGGELQ